MLDVPADKPLTAYRFWRRGLLPLRARRKKALAPWRLGVVKRAHMRPGPRENPGVGVIARNDPPASAVAGLWAFRRMSAARRERDTHGRKFGPLGKVQLWGRVAVHDWGYRAQFGKIVYAR